MREKNFPEAPVGLCPFCLKAVYNEQEGGTGPVWFCPFDLPEQHPWYRKSPVTPQEQDGDFSLCPSAHGKDEGVCERMLHFPMHGACYELFFAQGWKQYEQGLLEVLTRIKANTEHAQGALEEEAYADAFEYLKNILLWVARGKKLLGERKGEE